MFISKKKLKKYVEEIKNRNRAIKMGQDYEQPISPDQREKNIYLQGYEDGTYNFFNAVCHKFNLKRE